MRFQNLQLLPAFRLIAPQLQMFQVPASTLDKRNNG